MPKKEVIANYKGHSILARNTWFSGSTLIVDDEVVDRNAALLALDSSVSFLSHRLEIDGERHLVEVFIKAAFTVKLKICVDSKQIGGEDF
jgi:hypothetical protein